MRNILLMVVGMIGFSAYKLPVPKDVVKGKMYFSDKPFTVNNTGNKKAFKSSEFIYGRIELDGQTVKEAFKVWDPTEGYPYSYLLYRVFVFHNGEEMGQNTLNVCLLEQKDKNKTFLNFDVLPEPSRATTVLSGIERFDAGLFAAPFYGLINSNNFKEEGDYRIVVKFYYESYDAWGNRELVEKWPRLEDEFSFTFAIKDVAAIKRNETAANTVIENNFKKNKPK
jgi:hypothetical protein